LYKYNYGWEFISTKTSILNTKQSTKIFSDKVIVTLKEPIQLLKINWGRCGLGIARD
jgi:hypothetical protein